MHSNRSWILGNAWETKRFLGYFRNDNPLKAFSLAWIFIMLLLEIPAGKSEQQQNLET